MIILASFAFLAGIVTILSPCILPILPIILSSTIGSQSGKARPLGIILGFVLSFTFFTLFLSTIVSLTGIPANTLRITSIIIIAGFGISLLVPKFQSLLEQLFSKLSSFIPQGNTNPTFWSGILVGFSLGLLWTPCVGPILASVISLAITGSVNIQAFVITLAYSLGTSIPMFIIMVGGRNLLGKIPWLLPNTIKIQKVFGFLMIITALGIYLNLDRKFQTFILDKFPNYGVGLTKFEDNEIVNKSLKNIPESEVKKEDMGKPTFELLLPKVTKASEIISGGLWFNLAPNTTSLTIKELKGKVVIIDFWTYSCINCQRTLPYLKSWWEKYKDKGLVIIGIHSPEFEFEKDEKNVKKAIADFGLKYPIVQDNDFLTWRAYNNRYWPAKYFIDRDGYIRYTHFGEGDYNESEKVIQELLQETDLQEDLPEINNPEYKVSSKTPETYLGYARIANFTSGKITKDTISNYISPKSLSLNQFAFEGSWLVAKEYANPQKGSKLYLNFEAKEVYLVIKPKTGSSKVNIYIDNNKNDAITVDSDKLYKLIKFEDMENHILKLEFEDNNLELYAFTFG